LKNGSWLRVPATVAWILWLIPACAQTPPKIEKLLVRNRATHSIKAGETHSYQLSLKTSQYFSLRIEQLGVDVVVDAFGPDGKLIEEFDSPNGDQGPEVVTLVAPSNGDYRIDVRPLDLRAGLGNYEIELEEIRAAEQRDKDYETARRHSKDLANKLAEAVAKRDDDEIVRRFQEGVVELAHPKAEPGLLLARAEEAVQLPVAYRDRGEFQRGAALANKLTDLTEQNLGTNNRLFGKALAGSLTLVLEVGDSERAAALMVKATSFLDPKTSQPELFMTFLPLQGRLQIMQRQFFAAQTSFQTALSELETNVTSNNPLGAAVYVGLADAYAADMKYSQAEAAYQKALSIYERIAPSNYVQGFAFLGLGQMYMSQGKYADADQPFQRATRIFEQQFGSNHPETTQTQALLACNELFQGHDSDAQPLFDRSIKSIESSLGPNSSKLVPLLQWWATALAHAGKTQEAADVGSRIEKIRANSTH
jgi:tetratricopeptide (TPR) repeat protein